MKKITLLILLFGFVQLGWGQNEATLAEFEATFKKLNETYKKQKDSYTEEKAKLEELIKKVGVNSDAAFMTELSTQISKTKELNDVIVEQLELFRSLKVYYIYKGITDEKIDEAFEYTDDVDSFTQSSNENTEIKTFIYLGKDKVISRDEFESKSGIAVEVLKEVLMNTGEKDYLGDITIPKDNQEFYFYDNDGDISKVKFKFKKLDVEIRDGYFYDIRTFVETDDGNIHVFTNKVGISLLFYSQFGKMKKLLWYEYSLRTKTPINAENRYSDKNMSKLCIKVTDVMGYSYDAGNRYIPHDITIKLPNKEVDNKQSPAKYEIKQETHLEKIVELRAYTDFLALFGESNNGLAQIEGKAKFYLFPYTYRFFGGAGQIEYLPSFSPYANYSRFDEKSKYADLIADPNDSNLYSVKSELDLIEKRFLTVGGDVELFKWQHKNAPIKLSLYGTINYNISQVNFGTDQEPDVMNLKALNRGFGAHFSGRRFNNFGFDCKAEFTWYDYENFNDFKSNNSRKLILSSEIPVFKNEAELFYHTNGNPNQAIFVRLITYKYASSEPNQSFYQFQFGYKFAIGARKVNVPD